MAKSAPTAAPTATAAKIEDFTQDDRNANMGTPRGLGMVSRSLQQSGAGRSILVDRDGRIIAGNKTAECAADVGLTDAIVVKSDGTRLVVVQRTDITLDSVEGRRLALADNRTSEVSQRWDADVLTELAAELPDLDLGEMFFPEELADLGVALDLGDGDGEGDGEGAGDGDGASMSEQMTRALGVAWREWAGDMVTQFDTLASVGFVASGVSQAAAVIYFINAISGGSEYPRHASLAFHPHQPTTNGDLHSVIDGLRMVAEGKIKPERLAFVCGRPSASKLFSQPLPFAGVRMPLDFPASLARDLINEFSPVGGAVLDPCHGWGGRLVGFLMSTASHYRGVDVSDMQSAGVAAISDKLLPLVEGKTVSLTCSKFQDARLDDGAFDLAITSPPYFDTEKYVGGEQSHEIDNYGRWRDEFYGPMMRKVANALRPGGVFCLQVGSQRYPLATDGVTLGAEAGLKHVETRPTAIRRSGVEFDEGNDEVILVMRKV